MTCILVTTHHGWARACLHVYRLSTSTHIRCWIKSFADSLISSQYGESNSKSPVNGNKERDRVEQRSFVGIQFAIRITFQYLRKEVCVVLIIERRIAAQEDAANDSITKLVVAKTKATLPSISVSVDQHNLINLGTEKHSLTRGQGEGKRACLFVCCVC